MSRRAEIAQTRVWFSDETFYVGRPSAEICRFRARLRVVRPGPRWPLLSGQRRSSKSVSSCRPTSAVRRLARSASKRLATERPRSVAQALTGRSTPLRSRGQDPQARRDCREVVACCSADDDGVGLGDILQACGEVRRFANDGALRGLPGSMRYPTTTRSVAIPTRAFKAAHDFSAVTAVISSSLARTARSASSS